MKKIMIITLAVAGTVAAVCHFSPSLGHAAKGQIRKIENAAQLKYAVEILEEKNVEMRERFYEMSVGLKQLDSKVAFFAKKEADAKARFGADSANAKAYTDCLVRMNAAKDKMSNLRETLRKNVVQHTSNIEVLKAKLLCLESLKSVNGYLKDTELVGDDGISDLVENAILLQEAMYSAFDDAAQLKAEADGVAK